MQNTVFMKSFYTFQEYKISILGSANCNDLLLFNFKSNLLIPLTNENARRTMSYLLFPSSLKIPVGLTHLSLLICHRPEETGKFHFISRKKVKFKCYALCIM